LSLSNIFTNHLPSLDLHGYDRETARVAINDFIRDNIKMKNDKIIIVHGKGTGVLRKTTHETLSKNKSVEEFQIDFFNEGSTIVRVKI
jgi:DNA mismatch repair protein MutS2